MTKLESQLQVIDLLDSLLGQKLAAEFDALQMREWKVIQQHFSSLLEPHGSHGWDFSLMDWPTDVPLFALCIQQPSLKDVVPLDGVRLLLAGLELAWCVRLECLDSIQGKVMVGGPPLRDVLITKDEIFAWEA